MEVLVVEDNQDDVELVTLSLQRADKGIRVTAVSTIGDARNAIADHDFDIALLDLSLPDSFGLGTIKELQRVNERLPIIVLSGDDNENTALSAARLGVEDYVNKGEYIGAPFVRTLRYAVERKKGEQRLRDLADYDQLTRLSNRQRFNRQLLKAIGHAERTDETLGLLFIDLNEFKEVNDTLGHHAGDQLLTQVAMRFRNCVRGTDLVGRLGGDEFAILAESLKSPFDAEIVAAKVIEALQMPFVLGGHSVSIGASIGISMFPHDASDGEEMLTRADVAMYEAKRSGRNQILFYSSELNNSADERNRMLRELGRALSEEQFEVHYQPKVDVDTHELAGLEALVRWRHPERGLLHPAEFISFAEENGIISSIDDWVLKWVAEDIAAWQEANFDIVPVSVNVSASCVLRGDLYESISDLVRRTGVDPRFLEFELTESVLRAEYEDTRIALERIRRLGIGIWLNDFGTGYSTMSYLNEFPLDGICIARSFVNSLNHRRTQAIVRSIVTLAENLDLGVAAVGVEDEHELSTLKELGCSRAQGYFYGKPMDKDSIQERFLIERQGTVTQIMRAMPLAQSRNELS
ncbi:MAG: putative bifunctional diguanylate cyclase/phosphodiesterase [Woeseiaceae bacterium]